MRKGLGIAALVGTAVALMTGPRVSELRQPATWQRLVRPGQLSAAHRFLESDCASCHTAVKGAETTKCVLCHANNASLLQRQPTAFHANIESCKECHVEHQGVHSRPAAMDHAALAKIGLRQLRAARVGSTDRLAGNRLFAWVREVPDLPNLTSLERALDCAACHANEDRHYELFGQDCADCHSTDNWTVPEFRHPSPRSVDCAQCHQAPPSHYMEHFKMISRKVAGQHQADVRQCHMCHQTTSWNDIKGVGWYKHH